MDYLKIFKSKENVQYNCVSVFFALEDPEPGFSRSLMGLMGLGAVTGAGILKTIYIDRKTRLDISPQDVAVKNMLYYAYKASEIYEKSKPAEVLVYITSNCTHCNLTLTEYLDSMSKFGVWEKFAYEKSLFVPGIHFTSNRVVYMGFVSSIKILLEIYLNIFIKKKNLLAFSFATFAGPTY